MLAGRGVLADQERGDPQLLEQPFPPGWRRTGQRSIDEFQVRIPLFGIQIRGIGVVVPGQHLVEHRGQHVRFGEAQRLQEPAGVRQVSHGSPHSCELGHQHGDGRTR